MSNTVLVQPYDTGLGGNSFRYHSNAVGGGKRNRKSVHRKSKSRKTQKNKTRKNLRKHRK